ncbi:hypothetical protein [Prevotella falsenii]|uniref:hypothetical protein n=1 Tax=Prevotella falsenii TaxID=515414 RepID=UPI0004692CD0|nr:hypothetical protein [Prevotella falsenii]
MKTTSPYKVHWAIFTPTTGKVVTKKDEKVLSGSSYIAANRKAMKFYAKHFATKQDALDFIQNFNGKLIKKYKVRLLTDKQFGLSKINIGEVPEFPFTEKQKKEVYYL